MQPQSPPPAFVILPGVTADADRFAACQALARECWPQAEVWMPEYLSHLRGVRGTGRWLDRWAESALCSAHPVFVLAFILGGAALPHAPRFSSRLSRAVVVRSRYQEAIPRLLRRRFGWIGVGALWGRSIADLGAPSFWPRDFQLGCPQLTLVETRPSQLALRLKVAPLSDLELGIRSYQEVAVDHDVAYHSRRLMKAATEWLRADDVHALPI
jgi:hypothetical protein